MREPIEGSTSSSMSTVFLHRRRDPFEHALVPIPKPIFSDPSQTLISLKQKLLEVWSGGKVDAAVISESLQYSLDHPRVVLVTVSSVLPSSDPELPTAEVSTVDMQDLLMFLYIQSYKRLVARPQKDSVAVADVWPSTSAFDGYLSALWPLQFQLSLPGRNLFLVHGN